MKHKMRIAAAALGVAAAGYYFYSSKAAKQHRQIAAKWAKDFKKDVLKTARAAKNIDRTSFEGIVGSVAKTYHGVRNLDQKELERAARELKNNWQRVADEIGKGVSATKKTVGRVAKKAAKSARG